MALEKVMFKPGIDRDATRYTAGVGWYTCDKVRFRAGRPQKIGGWEKYTETSYSGVCRSLHDWSASDGANYLGIGTNLKFYVEVGQDIIDITPIRETTSAGDVTFAATNGSSTLTVSDTSHGAVGGLITAAVLNQEYRIISISDNDTYTIMAKDTNGDEVTANASDTGNGGASVVGEYQINVGTNTYVGGTGYGVGAYGAGPYGSGVALSAVNQLRLYSQDSFGDDLIFNPRGGSVYYWDESAGTATRGFDIADLGSASDTPTAALLTMVSDVDRHVVCFGVNPLGSGTIDPLLVRWSDQEDAGNWTPSATNTAGGQVLSAGTAIIGVAKTRHEMLIFTDVGITSMAFSGAPFVFEFTVVAENVSLMGPNAHIVAGDTVYFMDRDGFYAYRGAVEPIPCPVYQYVFDNIQLDQRYKVFATVNQDDNEIIWFYPVGTSTADITNYVIYNYLDNHWSIGTMARGAWIHAGTRNYPIAASNDVDSIDSNYIYNQEYGHDADGAELVGYAESGSVELGDGEHIMFLRRAIPDFYFAGTSDNADITVTIKGKKYPMEDIATLDSSTVTSSTTQCPMRARAREMTLRIESAGLEYGWTMGDFRFDMKPDGRR
jgi:hypothetical protein